MSDQFFVTTQTQTFKVTLSWGSEVGWGWWTAASSQALQPLGGPTRRCLSHPSYHSSHLWAAGHWTAAATGAHPAPIPVPNALLHPGPWEGSLGSRTADRGRPGPGVSAPLPPTVSQGCPNEALRAPRRGDPEPRRRGQWVMKPPGRITAEGAGWERGGGEGLELVPKLTCSPAGGWRRRGRGESASPGVSGAALASPPSPCPTSPQSCAVGLTVPGAVPVPGLGAGET